MEIHSKGAFINDVTQIWRFPPPLSHCFASSLMYLYHKKTNTLFAWHHLCYSIVTGERISSYNLQMRFWTITWLFFCPVFRPLFEYRTISQPDTNLPFKYQNSPIFRRLLYLDIHKVLYEGGFYYTTQDNYSHLQAFCALNIKTLLLFVRIVSGNHC